MEDSNHNDFPNQYKRDTLPLQVGVLMQGNNHSELSAVVSLLLVVVVLVVFLHSIAAQAVVSPLSTTALMEVSKYKGYSNNNEHGLPLLLPVPVLVVSLLSIAAQVVVYLLLTTAPVVVYLLSTTVLMEDSNHNDFPNQYKRDTLPLQVGVLMQGNNHSELSAVVSLLLVVVVLVVFLHSIAAQAVVSPLSTTALMEVSDHNKPRVLVVSLLLADNNHNELLVLVSLLLVDRNNHNKHK